MRKTIRTIGGLLAAALFWAQPVLACPVCYGEADNAVIDGAKLSVIFMGALVYVLIGGGIALAVIAHRRAVKNLDPHKGLRLLPPERG